MQNAGTLRKDVSQGGKYTAPKGVHTSQNTRKCLRLLRYISYVHRFSFRAPSIKGDRGTTIEDQCRAYNKLGRARIMYITYIGAAARSGLLDEVGNVGVIMG